MFYYKEIEAAQVASDVRAAAIQGLRAASVALGMGAPRVKWFAPCEYNEWVETGRNERYRHADEVYGIANCFSGISLSAKMRPAIGIFGTVIHELYHMWEFETEKTPRLRILSNDGSTATAEQNAQAFVLRLLSQHFYPENYRPTVHFSRGMNSRERRRFRHMAC